MNFINYIKESRAEMIHVKWPTKSQAFGYSVLVVIVSVGVAAFLGLFDYVFSTLLKLIV
ncbi:MAG: preprotein translocase subunit SecE [Patescibacteria group bacterium]